MKKAFISLLIAAQFFGCANHPSGDSADRPLVEDKYRLSKDREAFEQIRKDVPPETKTRNDELALILEWMGTSKKSPESVRDKFNSLVSKKRDAFNRDLEKRRTEYVRKEQKDRDAFTKEMETNRNEFVAKNPKREAKTEFFENQDMRRRDFYSDQREKRDAFEADVRDQRKNFDDYIREKTQEFNQEHRAYTKKYDDEQKKLEEQKTRKTEP